MHDDAVSPLLGSALPAPGRLGKVGCPSGLGSEVPARDQHHVTGPRVCLPVSLAYGFEITDLVYIKCMERVSLPLPVLYFCFTRETLKTGNKPQGPDSALGLSLEATTDWEAPAELSGVCSWEPGLGAWEAHGTA